MVKIYLIYLLVLNFNLTNSDSRKIFLKKKIHLFYSLRPLLHLVITYRLEWKNYPRSLH